MKFHPNTHNSFIFPHIALVTHKFNIVLIFPSHIAKYQSEIGDNQPKIKKEKLKQMIKEMYDTEKNISQLEERLRSFSICFSYLFGSNDNNQKYKTQKENLLKLRNKKKNCDVEFVSASLNL